MALTNLAVKQAKPKVKTYRLFDGSGLYLEITPKGQKYWRYKYRFLKKEKRLALGVYPSVSLKEARDKRFDAAKLLEKGIDPSAERKAKKERAIQIHESTFAHVAHEWHVKHHQNKSEGYSKRVWRALEKDVFPTLANLPIGLITGPQVRKTILKIEEREAYETAHRTLQICGRIFSYANAMGYCNNNPCLGIKQVLTPVKHEHFAYIDDPKRVGELMRAINGYESIVTRTAMQVIAYTFLRPGNIRRAEWTEIDLQRKLWKIYPDKMKTKNPHLVPLANQVVNRIESLRAYTSNSRYIFPSVRNIHNPMSDGTINAALRCMGYAKEDMSAHGFRHMASTLLNEQAKWTPDAIEKQLAHTDKSKIRATYNHSKHLAERSVMMQAWADYLDQLANQNTVIPISKYAR